MITAGDEAYQAGNAVSRHVRCPDGAQPLAAGRGQCVRHQMPSDRPDAVLLGCALLGYVLASVPTRSLPYTTDIAEPNRDHA